jgi:hypothetical protein
MIRPRTILFATCLASLLSGAQATAQPYCMIDEDGQRSCGIPTLQSCEDSARGIGASCVVDDSAQLPPPVQGPLQRMFERERDQANPNLPYTDDVPPPPGN